MGRKPSKLILEFFERGAKLEDSSNRYQHTCKSCGEKFPKGRIDSLTAHLLKKCPAIPQQDRQRALQQLSETPNQHGSFNQLALALRQEQENNGEAPAFQPGNDLSPLETLAEVSRQQLDTKGQYVPAPETGRKRKRTGGRPQAMSQNQQHHQHQFAANDFVVPRDPMQNQVDIRDAENSSNSTNSRLLRGVEEFLTEERPRFDNNTAAPTARMIPDQLAMTASAANDMLPGAVFPLDPKLTGPGAQTDPGHDHSMIDPQLQDAQNMSGDLKNIKDDQESAEHQLQMLTQNTDSFGGPLTGPARSGNGTNTSLPQTHFMTDFSITGEDPKPKVRSRFSETRRKEVQEVRKQGACVRCRMLKKPCSGGTPCNTCSAVETARLWKSSCIRARLTDEFDLYTAGLYTVTAFHDVNLVKSGIEFSPNNTQIEATHFPNRKDRFLSARTVSASFQPSETPESISHLWNDVEATFANAQVELVDQDVDDIGSNLENYMKEAGSLFFQREPSTFMRPTLLLAQELVDEKNDLLLRSSLELWTATQILVDSDMPWHIFSVESTDAEYKSGNTERSDMLDNTNPFSYRLMSQQLLSQVEKRGGAIAKRLLNDLERRLLQRQQTSSQHFETFLTAVILLNCIERTAWLFSTWAAKQERALHNGTMQLQPTAWPLEKDPHTYMGNGDKIAEVIAMMVRVRGVPPPNVTDEQGILRAGSKVSWKQTRGASSGETDLDGHNNGSATHAPVSERDPVVQSWFNEVNISVDALKQLQTPMTWDERDCRCWDLRYISRLLLSEK